MCTRESKVGKGRALERTELLPPSTFVATETEAAVELATPNTLRLDPAGPGGDPTHVQSMPTAAHAAAPCPSSMHAEHAVVWGQSFAHEQLKP